MSKSVVLLLVLVFLTASCTVIAEPASSDEMKENSWTTRTPMPQAISDAKAAVANGKIYVMTTDVNYEYDPATDNWTAKTTIPTPRYSFVISAYQNKIYVIGGYYWVNGTLTLFSVNQAYDPSTDTWETKASMPTARKAIVAETVNGKIYLIGGSTFNSSDPYTSVNEVYDPANDSWTTKQPAPITATNYVSAIVDNKIYVMAAGTDSNLICDVENDTWSFGASLPTRIYRAAAVATTGVMAPKRIYVIEGGIIGLGITEPSNLVYVYDPALDNWSSGTPMPTNRTSLAVGVVDDVLYAMGGAIGWEGGELVGSPILTNVV